MAASDPLRELILALEELRIPYALGGSIAAIAYGEPRTTLDIDVVADLVAEDVERLKTRFPEPEFFLDAKAALEAVIERAQFNIIHISSAMKIDVFVPSDDVARSQIYRSRRFSVLPGLAAEVSPPEELIVKKMVYYREGGSERHLRDVASMLSVSDDLIDRQRIQDLTERLGLEEVWALILHRVDPSV